MFLIQPVFLVLVQIQNVAHELVRIYGIYFAALSMSTVLLIPRAVREKPQAGLKWVPYWRRTRHLGTSGIKMGLPTVEPADTKKRPIKAT